MRESGLAQDISPKQLCKLKEQMSESIRVSTERLEAEVFDMEETLVALVQDYIKELEQEMI